MLQRLSPTHVTLTCVTRVTFTWRAWNLKQCQFSCSLPCTQTHITCHSLSHRSGFLHLLLDPQSFLWWSGYFHSRKDQGWRYILQWKKITICLWTDSPHFRRYWLAMAVMVYGNKFENPCYKNFEMVQVIFSVSITLSSHYPEFSHLSWD